MRLQLGTCRSIALGVAVLALGGCGGGGANDGAVVEYDFSDAESEWPTVDDARVLLEHVDGGYRVVLRDPTRPHASWLQVSEGEQALTIEADAALTADPGQAESRESWGIACSSALGPDRVTYFFYITSDGLWAIGREGPEPELEEFIERAEGVERPTETRRLRAECLINGDSTATVAFAVDGRELIRTTDPHGPAELTTIALHIRAEAANTEVRFDNVSVRRDAQATTR